MNELASLGNLASLGDRQILAARGRKNRVDPLVPWAFLVEPERSALGEVVDVATIFLTNRECPFRCLMCDLWQNTLDEPTPPGAIPRQIEHALARLPPARQIKLYNSGNFFDPLAIPPGEYAAIADLATPFENVIVENHPRLCGGDCLRFRDLLPTRLDVALGLETVQPKTLRVLNKRMTLADFDRAAEFLLAQGIAVRAFILLKPPGVGEQAGIEAAIASAVHAFDRGATCCSIIPTRGGNGIMEKLAARGLFAPPRLASLESVLQAGIELRRGRVLVDLWDVEKLATCPHCGPRRIERLRQMNLSQDMLPAIVCACSGAS
jgi:radical SAM enzyme (TIGR01210 family)